MCVWIVSTNTIIVKKNFIPTLENVNVMFTSDKGKLEMAFEYFDSILG
jgi:hypothetical protein